MKTSNQNIVYFPSSVKKIHGIGVTNRPAVSGRPGAPADISADIVSLAERRAETTAPRVKEPTIGPLSLGEVWDALDEGRIEMHYQPQYDLATGEVVAAEALVRLIDLEGQLLFPDRFIELTERSDLIVPLGRAVIERVCADLTALRASGVVMPRVAINLSAHQLNRDSGMASFVGQTLESYGLAYSDLEFELTERQRLASTGEYVETLEILAARGARIAIDDFGIGYSSVLCLTELPISALKLDRALISRLPENKAIQSVVRCLLDLATHLDLNVIAEGVETTLQHDWLTATGCKCGQGFGYARPMAIEPLRSLLETPAVKARKLIEQ